MFNTLRLMICNICAWIVAKLTTKEVSPEPLAAPEKPSTRYRRLRKEKVTLEAQKATVAPATPVIEPAQEAKTDRQALAPEVNPFSAGGVDGQVPMCMDALPNFVVFEAMFNKKYGVNGKCPLSVQGTAHAYSALELYTLLSKIETDGEKAGPVYNALYGTVYSVIINQHGKKIESKELN